MKKEKETNMRRNKLEVESNNWNGEFLWFFWYHLKLISFSKFFTQKCCNKRFVLSDSDDNNDQEIQTFSLNNVSDVCDHSFVIEMDSMSSDSYKETIEGRKEPDFKTPMLQVQLRQERRKVWSREFYVWSVDYV
jgi:REP element-mobilizing transposase RayT